VLKYAVPLPDETAAAGIEKPALSNPSDIVYITSRRYHRESCRYAKNAQPCALAYAKYLKLSPAPSAGHNRSAERADENHPPL
jgi:hypothetical protein